MKKITFFWRHLALILLLIGAVAANNAVAQVIVDVPPTTDLGDRAFGSWAEGTELLIENTGTEDAIITSIDLDDPSTFFSFEGPASFPFTLDAGDDLTVIVHFNAPSLTTAPGVYDATFVVTYNGAVRDVAAGDLTVNGYEPPFGDVVENPQTYTITGPPLSASTENVSEGREFGGIYKNYILPNDLGSASDDQDWVVELTVEEDALLDVWFSVGTITNVALYAGDFGGYPGPMAGNALIQNLTNIDDFPVFEGTYYIVFSSHGAFTGNWSHTYMTAPAAITYNAPLDGAVNIGDGDELDWEYNDAQVEEYQVILGTTYPPTDVVVDWTTAGASGDVYELIGLEANLQYFWQINVRNNVDETPGDIWGFTTTISTPQDVVALDDELFEGDFTELSWTSPLDAPRALLGYNVYRDADGPGGDAPVMINTSLVTGSTYEDTEVLDYNMSPGYTYNVTSVFDEGESAFSDDVIVQFSGEETLSGTVTDDVTGLPIEGATVDMDGKDEYSNNVSYSTTTNGLGFYTADVKAGVYDVTVSAAGYNNGLAEDVAVDYGTPETEDFALTELAYPVESVTAVELSDDEVEITWVPDDSRELLGYTVYRVPVLNEPGSMIPVLTVGSTTGAILIDEDWGTAVPGVYTWAVEANYSLGNNSVWVHSNELDKDMETVVDVVVTTEYGDDPVATVTFTNTSEPALMLEYTETLDATGLYTFDPFRKGTYDIMVELYGYETVNLTDVDIWDAAEFVWELDGAAPPPENLVADNDSLYMPEDAKLSWDVPASSEFHGYIVYRNGVALFDIPIAETNYTDVAPPYNMDGHIYTVEAVYLSGDVSVPSEPEEVWVTGKGMVDGTVYDGRTDLEIEGAEVRLDGFDEFGYPQSYVFMTDEDGYYEDEDGVWAGDYDYSVTAMGYGEATDMDVVEYDENTALDFVLFPAMTVTATEQDDDNVLVEWTFDMDETRELIDFTIYRTLWNVDAPIGWTELGATTGSSFIDSDWGTVPSGVYKWVVEANYTVGGSTVAFSNYLDKDMETVVNVEVVLNTAESPEGTEVTLENLTEPYLDLTYELVMDASGMATIDPFRKGTYEVTVELFGFATIFDLVVVDDETDLYYVLEEQITAVGNLYVNPNGYATWNMPTPGGLDMFVADFEGGLPATMTYVNNGSSSAGDWVSTIYGYIGDGAFSFWSAFGGYTDTRMNTPKVALEDGMVVDFAWLEDNYTPTDLTIEISFNEGLTWTPIWNQNDESLPTFTWYETTLDLDALGYTDGDAMFSIHKTDDYGGRIWFDELYIGPAPDAMAGTVAISTSGTLPEGMDKSNFDISVVMADVEMLSNNLLAPANAGSERSFQNFKVSLDEIFSGDTEDMFYDYEVAETLVEGEEYEAKVEAVYTTGISDPMYYTFIYHACDYYNDAEDFTATRVEGTLDIMLEWTNDDSDVDTDEFIGTNVYRDGEMIAFVEDGTEMYTDADLASGTYNYCITQVYESDAQSCEVCAEAIMTAGGYVNGYVTEFATGDPIEGASVALTGATDNFLFTTDEDGYYEGEVVEGTYDYNVSAPEYRPETLMDVFIDFGATVVNDFALKEFPYPVGDVLAWELDDNAVQVTWGGQVPPGTSGWLTYDDGVNWNSLGNSVSLTMSWAHRFEPAQLLDYPNCAVTEITGYIGDDYGNATTIYARVWSGADAGTLLYEEDVTDQVTIEDWNAFELSSAVPFDNTEELWIGFYGEAGGASYPAGLSNTAPANANGDLYNSGTGWLHASDLGAGDLIFNLSGYVTTEYGEKVAIGGKQDVTRYKSASSIPTATLTDNESYSYAPKTLDMLEGTRELVGYNVYRGPCDGEAEDFEFQGFTLDQQFTDNTWGVAEPGIYKWAVEVVYEYDNFSQYAYSNCLDKDMITTVTVEVTTNSGDSPEGTEVIFTNVSEPMDPPITFEVELDASGIYTWDDFRKGTYDIYVHLNGFADIMVEDVYIWDAAYFEFVLEELLAPPADLYVTPTGFATWRQGGVVPFTPYMETFDEGLPETWTIVAGGDTDDTWFWTTDDAGSTLDGTPFMFVDSDAAGTVDMDEYLYSPIIENTESADMLYLEFDQYLNNFLDEDIGIVEVFDGDEWVMLLNQTTDVGSWATPDHQMIDVTEYANSEFQVRFHYMANYGWYWAVDNFAVTEGDSKYADRALEYYKVWHDYTFVTDRDTTFYQYGDNGEDLVPGTTYMAEVAAVYSTGISDKMMYEWTYLPCDSFPGFEQMMAANVEPTNNVLVTWTDNLAAPDEYMQDFEGTFPPAGWMKASPDGGTGWEGIATGTTPLPGWTGGEATACPDGGAQMAYATWTTGGASSNDQWLISPMLESFTGFELSFYMRRAYDAYDENVDILISTTGTDIADFDVVVEEVFWTLGDTEEWELYTYDLTEFVASGTPFYVAFREHVADNFANGAAVFVDNFYVGPAMDMAIPQPMGIVSAGSRMADYIHTPQADAPYQEVNLRSGSRALEVLGANVYRDGEMIAYVALPDTMYLDENLDPGYYDYCVAKVYTDDEGLHTWTSCPGGQCVEDVLVPEDCDAPVNLTATLDEETYDAIYLNWNENVETEFRYDDGVRTAQLGFNGGTTNSVLGAAHFVDAELTELSWMLSDEATGGGPHATVTLYVMGLTTAGLPDETNVLFTTEVANVDGIWNTFTFNEPLVVEGGFFLGAAYAGFVGLGTDDGLGAPWEYIPGTHFYAVDYTTGAWTAWEPGFALNGTIRAAGTMGATVSYPDAPAPQGDGIAPEIRMLAEAVPTGTPNWSNPIASANREFMGYNIYRDGEVIEELWPDNTYTDTEGLEAGNVYCYEVTAMYSVCGESDPSNEACAGFVGIAELDAGVANLYPNPARDQITIEAADMTRLHVVNYVGQVVYNQEFDSSSSKSLNTANYQSGVYVARIYTEAGVITKRFVINR